MLNLVKTKANLMPLQNIKIHSDYELLKKYDVSGPRYTSYPTAAQFDPAFNENMYLEQMQNNVENIAPLSLYIHLPFCQSICYYCACNKIVSKDKSVVRNYLNHLQKEMAILRLQLNLYKRPVTQLHWGGGTPTFLDVGEMTELMHYTARYFNLTNDESHDYSIEIDPRTATESTIDFLRGIGFNRISLGIQDFNPVVQKAVNREQSIDSITQLVEYIRARSFRSLNFDLIYGLPHQNEKSLNETIDSLVKLSPDRINFYNYAHLPQRFTSQRAIDRLTLPSAEEKLRMLSTIIDRLTDAGYIYIGMDNFVKPGDSLAIAASHGKLYRNFQGYSVAHAKELVGLGVSSISSFERFYSQNYRDLDSYYKALDNNQLPIEQGMQLSDEDELRSTIIQQLICYRKLNINDIEKRYAVNFMQHFADAIKKLKPLVDDNIVEVSKELITIPQQGFPFLRNICMAFDAYIDESLLRGYTYSKTL